MLSSGDAADRAEMCHGGLMHVERPETIAIIVIIPCRYAAPSGIAT